MGSGLLKLILYQTFAVHGPYPTPYYGSTYDQMHGSCGSTRLHQWQDVAFGFTSGS